MIFHLTHLVIAIFGYLHLQKKRNFKFGVNAWDFNGQRESVRWTWDAPSVWDLTGVLWCSNSPTVYWDPDWWIVGRAVTGTVYVEEVLHLALACVETSDLTLVDRLSFFGHLCRADTGQDHSRALRACIRGPPKDWRWRTGRPRQTWLRTVEDDLRPLNFGLATARWRAMDRPAWRLLVDAATSSWHAAERDHCVRYKCFYSIVSYCIVICNL